MASQVLASRLRAYQMAAKAALALAQGEEDKNALRVFEHEAERLTKIVSGLKALAEVAPLIPDGWQVFHLEAGIPGHIPAGAYIPVRTADVTSELGFDMKQGCFMLNVVPVSYRDFDPSAWAWSPEEAAMKLQ